MNGYILPFRLAGHRFGLELERVLRVLAAVSVTPLPGAPSTIRGVVNVRGRIVPVADLALRIGWPAEPLGLWQPFIWVATQARELLLPVQSVEPTCFCPVEDWEPANHPRLPTALLSGVVRTSDGLLLIQDLEALLSQEDQDDLDQALAARHVANA